MNETNPFEEHQQEYDQWFEEHEEVYKTELQAIEYLLPEHKQSLEIGVGTGRFAQPLEIKTGIDPAEKALKIAAERGIEVKQGRGEDLPFSAASFEVVLIVTTLCFLDDVDKTFQEVNRVLKKDGNFILGFIDRESPLGQMYLQYKEENVFYKHAEFHSTAEVLNLLAKHNFKDPEIVQTVFGGLEDVDEIQDFEPGYGEGGFVVVKVKK